MAAIPQNVRMPLMTVSEACELLRIHPSTMYRLIKQRQIPYFRLGTDYRFNREAIERWSRSQEQKSTR